MDERYRDLEKTASLQGMLGYLNFAGGKADARFQRQLNDAYGFLAEQGAEEPWHVLQQLLQGKLETLKTSDSSAFRDARQAEAVLVLGHQLLAVYQQHHADLLFHLSARDLFQPFFVACAFEAVLAQGPPWEDRERIITGALRHLNDFVGHRPIAILETRPKGEPYDHERVRPIPLFIRGAGVAWGRYHRLVRKTLEILGDADPGILAEAYFDLEFLDELAVDPRAYDHGHPANRRPNHVFGEWDPHQIDIQARYRRYVARQVTLEALLDRVEHPGDLPPEELLFEAAAVLAGTVLMATGTSGSGPATHDSFTTLATLMPRIARYRDAFYASLLHAVGGAHGERLRQEEVTSRQPFGGARQHLNQYLAHHRAMQLQQRQLAILFAEMGYPEASRKETLRIPTASIRMLSEILSRLTTGQLHADRGDLAQAVRVLPETEDLLQRGIACGALADPWNILGFQGLFPLFTAREDSIRDHRIDELVHVVEQIFNFSSRLISESAAAGDKQLSDSLLVDQRRLADWWDRFASVEVSDVRRVHGGETIASAAHVAQALARWHERGEKTADLSFWKEHLDGFHSSKAFALVVDALLHKQDYRAAMALLINWLGQVEQVSLEDGEYSFHTLTLRWMLGVTREEDGRGGPGHEATLGSRAKAEVWPLVKKFFDYLEANAEEYWQVPNLEFDQSEPGEEPEEKEESIYSAAYEEVIYRDSADDNQEGAVADGSELHEPFDLEQEGDRLGKRLRFLSTVARLWQIAARYASSIPAIPGAPEEDRAETLGTWLAAARENHRRLMLLVDHLHQYSISEPLGSYDSLVEFDRRRNLKEQLLYLTIGTCLDTLLAVGSLAGALGEAVETHGLKTTDGRPPWEKWIIQIERMLLGGDSAGIRSLLPPFLKEFHKEPLLFTALADGGDPRQILRVRLAQAVLRALVVNLPRLGLLRETFHLLETARAMEQAHPAVGRRITEFNQLFQAGFQAVVEAIVDSAPAQTSSPRHDQELVDLLEAITRPFLALWVEHSQTLQLSALEPVAGKEDWDHLCRFTRTYGADLFHAKFMTLANLRGILHGGIDAYLDYLRDNPDPLHPVRLIDDLDQAIPRNGAVRWLGCILQALVENYEEYKDYNTTTPQSDYGENLHILLDFLRLKVGYERHGWRLRPLTQAHEVLARSHRVDLAVSWQDAFTRLVEDLAGQYVEHLAQLERTHGIRLRTVADLIQERFVKSLALDRLCSLIEPAMKEARQSEPSRSFARLEKELQPLTANPTGVGLDIPQWLRRLHQEVQRVRATETSLAILAEEVLRVPKKPMTLEELRQQFAHEKEPPSSD